MNTHTKHDMGCCMRPDVSSDIGRYVGRFAPSPTGALHAGSMVAALASWLDARAHNGKWLVRIEDVDRTRCSAEAHRTILQQLQQHALLADAEPLVQSQRDGFYQNALNRLVDKQLAYPCTCSRSQIAAALAAQGHAHARHGERVYPGTCRPQTSAPIPKHMLLQPRTAWRLHVQACLRLQQQGGGAHTADNITRWTDRRLGAQQQNVPESVGDFVLRRSDGLWAYQLAVVTDDAAQGITHVVRGEDLADNTARQMVLQQALGLPQLQYLHTPLVCNSNGDKLSKQNAAPAVVANTVQQALQNLQAAAHVLGLPAHAQGATLQQALAQWTADWAKCYCGHARAAQ